MHLLMSSGDSSPNSYRLMRCMVKMRRSSMLRRMLCRLLYVKASHAAGICHITRHYLLMALWREFSQKSSCAKSLLKVHSQARGEAVTHIECASSNKAKREMCMRPTCQSAWMGLERR